MLNDVVAELDYTAGRFIVKGIIMVNCGEEIGKDVINWFRNKRMHLDFSPPY